MRDLTQAERILFEELKAYGKEHDSEFQESEQTEEEFIEGLSEPEAQVFIRTLERYGRAKWEEAAKQTMDELFGFIAKKHNDHNVPEYARRTLKALADTHDTKPFPIPDFKP